MQSLTEGQSYRHIGLRMFSGTLSCALRAPAPEDAADHPSIETKLVKVAMLVAFGGSKAVASC